MRNSNNKIDSNRQASQSESNEKIFNKESISQYDLDCSDKQKVHVLLPAYNEEKSLPNLLMRFSQLNTHEKNSIIIWVVDDGSVDETAAIVKKGISGINLHLLQHRENLGLGQALGTGLITVLENSQENDIVIVMDADDTHDVALIESMKKKLSDGADIVIASRFVKGGDDSSAPIFRRILSRVAAIVFRTVFPLKDLKDITGGYRAYKTTLLRKAYRHWGEGLVQEEGFACMVEILLKLRYLNPKIEEVPFVLKYDRKMDQSKLKLIKTIKQYLKLAVRERITARPRKPIEYSKHWKINLRPRTINFTTVARRDIYTD